MKDEFPKELHHPNYRKGKSTPIGEPLQMAGGKLQDYQGEPDLFPPVTVNNEQQEAFYRAKGYLVAGEVPPPPADYAEYPVMLSHPDHVDAIPDDFDVKKDNGGVVSTRIPGKPEKFPPVMVSDAAQEKEFEKKGYHRVGVADGAASERAKASPYDPDFKSQEYPKMVNGVLVDPYAELDHNRYPMWIGDQLVNNEAEEASARGEPLTKPLKKCVICGDDVLPDQEVGSGPLGTYHADHFGGNSNVAPVVVAEKKRGGRPRKVPLGE